MKTYRGEKNIIQLLFFIIQQAIIKIILQNCKDRLNSMYLFLNIIRIYRQPCRSDYPIGSLLIIIVHSAMTPIRRPEEKIISISSSYNKHIFFLIVILKFIFVVTKNKILCVHISFLFCYDRQSWLIKNI